MHDGQAQLRVLVQGVDVVVLEEHPHTGVQQLPGVLNGVQRVAGEPGDLLGDDEVEQPGPAVLHHAVKVLPLPGGGGGQALVDVARHVGPVGVFADQAFVVLNLVAQGVELFVGFTGHTGIEGHPEREVIDRAGL